MDLPRKDLTGIMVTYHCGQCSKEKPCAGCRASLAEAMEAALGAIAASPQQTFDCIIGTGAFTEYDWWQRAKRAGVAADGTAEPGWSVEVTYSDEDDIVLWGTITHEVIMDAARKAAITLPRYASEELGRQCILLLTSPRAASFDAYLADQLLQFILIGFVLCGQPR